jgi:uncharacterized membrane protein YsdA (DUF1294 family)/cold shock CspA family protein
MRFAGRIIDWDDTRGFGFVVPNGGGERAFVHIKAFERRPGRPADGMAISYAVVKDERGRLNATAVRLATPASAATTRARAGLPRRAIAAAFLAALGAGWLAGRVPSVVVLTYAAMSLVTFAMYARDKVAAKHGRWRTPEDTLHGLALLCGWPGALFAQDRYRHKSSKARFQRTFWATVVLNCGALAWLLQSHDAARIDAVFGL